MLNVVFRNMGMRHVEIRKPVDCLYVEIGKRFSGKHKLNQDLDTGDYSESLPLIQGDMLKLQRCLLESKNV